MASSTPRLGISESRRLIGSYVIWRFDTPSFKVVAEFEGLLKALLDYAPTIELHNRFDRDEDDLLVDQGDGRPVRITADGFQSEPYDRPRFRRHPAMLSFADPEPAEPSRPRSRNDGPTGTAASTKPSGSAVSLECSNSSSRGVSTTPGRSPRNWAVARERSIAIERFCPMWA